MKTPKEQSLQRAWCEYRNQEYVEGFVTPLPSENFERGYQYGHRDALAGQWRNADDYPPIDEDVLVDYPYEHGYAVAYFDGEDWYITETGRLIRPIKWMPIPPDNNTEPNNEQS